MEQINIVEPLKNQSNIKILKVKKGVPTIIEYCGRRYILNHKDGHK